jgi:hypothetical protein
MSEARGFSSFFGNLIKNQKSLTGSWELNDEAEECLQQYYRNNKLLVDCLNSKTFGDGVKEAIEDTLLLPIAVSGSG